MSMIRFACIMTLNAFALGITLPVLNVVLLARGLTLSTLALFMAIYSAVIVVTEIPSGYLSDRFGRIPVFMTAKVCTAAGMVLVVFTSSAVPLFMAAVLMAIARSFSSGSFEAVVIDWFREREGEQNLHVITTNMSVWETLGLSAGALASGFAALLFERIGLFSDGRVSVFLISACLQLLIIFFIAIWMGGDSRKEPAQEMQPSAGQFLTSLKNRQFLSLLILTFALGFLLSSIEKYWQPKIIGIIRDEDLATVLFGVVSFIGFMTALLGSILSGKLINRNRSRTGIYLVLLRLLLAASLLALAASRSPVSFLVLYASVYLFVAMSSVASGTIINTESPPAIRASLLSTVSFSLQIGGLVSSLFASVWLAGGVRSISSLWSVAAALVIVSLIPFIMHESGKSASVHYELRTKPLLDVSSSFDDDEVSG